MNIFAQFREEGVQVKHLGGIRRDLLERKRKPRRKGTKKLLLGRRTRAGRPNLVEKKHYP